MDAPTIKKGGQFESIEVARKAISQYVLDNGESFETAKSD
jgi:hypothetical protein